MWVLAENPIILRHISVNFVLERTNFGHNAHNGRIIKVPAYESDGDFVGAQ